MYSPTSDPRYAPGVRAGRPSRLATLLVLCLLTLMLAGCSAAPQTQALYANTPASAFQRQELVDVPFHPQQQYQCGPAALSTMLEYSGVEVTPDALVSQVYVPQRQGSFQVEMLAATRGHERLAYPLAPTLEALMAAIDEGHPVLVLQNLALDWYPRWHYAVVIGYDLEQRQIILRSGVTRRLVADMKVFERTWKRSNYWGMVALQPGELPSFVEPLPYFRSVAAFERSAPEALVEAAWQAGVQRWPRDRRLAMGYGNYLYAQRAFVAAAEQYRRVLKNTPDYAPALNNLAQSLLDAGQPQAAADYAQQALEQATSAHQRALFNDTLAQALKALGR